MKKLFLASVFLCMVPAVFGQTEVTCHWTHTDSESVEECTSSSGWKTIITCSENSCTGRSYQQTEPNYSSYYQEPPEQRRARIAAQRLAEMKMIRDSCLTYIDLNDFGHDMLFKCDTVLENSRTDNSGRKCWQSKDHGRGRTTEFGDPCVDAALQFEQNAKASAKYSLVMCEQQSAYWPKLPNYETLDGTKVTVSDCKDIQRELSKNSGNLRSEILGVKADPNSVATKNILEAFNKRPQQCAEHVLPIAFCDAFRSAHPEMFPK